MSDEQVFMKYIHAFNQRASKGGFRTPPPDMEVPRNDFDAIARAIEARCQSTPFTVIPDGMETIQGYNCVLRWKDEPREHMAFKGVKMFPSETVN